MKIKKLALNKAEGLKLPALCIRGPLDQLMEVETLMILLGYTSDEQWNQSKFNGEWASDKPFIEFNSENNKEPGVYGYFSHQFGTDTETFQYNEISRILLYIEIYQHKTNK